MTSSSPPPPPSPPLELPASQGRCPRRRGRISGPRRRGLTYRLLAVSESPRYRSSVIEIAEIERMSLAERLQTMELLWRSISRNPRDVVSPNWHGEVLKKRLAKVKAGEGEFLTMTQLKKRLGKRTA